MPAPRRYRDQTFRKSDVVRALKAAQSAGMPNPRVEIDRLGTITLIPGEPEETTDGGGNEWDTVLRK